MCLGRRWTLPSMQFLIRLINRKLKLFILLEHFFLVGLSLYGLLKLQVLAPDLLLLLLDDLREVGTKVLVSFNVQRLATDDILNFLLQLIDHLVFLRKL